MSYGTKFKTALTQTGYFVGNFFGINDEWNNNKTKRTFFNINQVKSLFANFEITSFKEIEKDAPAGNNTMKHWHFFTVIARKTK